MRKSENVKIQEHFVYNWVDYYINLIENGAALLEQEDIELQILPSDEYVANDLVSYSKAIAIKGRRTGKSIALSDKGSYIVNKL